MEKIVIYQIFTRVCCNSGGKNVPGGDIKTNGSGKLNSYTPVVLDNIKSMGVTHIWFTGLIAHASCTGYRKFGIPESHAGTVKGRAGSPYAIRDYYDIDPDLAISVPDRMAEFQALVNRVHSAGMKFIMDFVPNHVAREYRSTVKPNGVKDLGETDNPELSFSPQNNFYYMPGQQLSGEPDWGDYKEFPARATGNDKFSATPSYSDWYETVKLNYGVDYMAGGTRCFDPIPDTWKKMLEILLFWAGKGVDAFRCDMAEMVPVEFWDWAVSRVKKAHKNIQFIAEIYNPGSYWDYINRGHFDYIYDKVGLYAPTRHHDCHAVLDRADRGIHLADTQTDSGFPSARMGHVQTGRPESAGLRDPVGSGDPLLQEADGAGAACRKDPAGLRISSAHGGGVGICVPCGNGNGVPLGERIRRGRGKIRQRPGQEIGEAVRLEADEPRRRGERRSLRGLGAGGIVQAQCVRIVRHAGKRGGMVLRLVFPQHLPAIESFGQSAADRGGAGGIYAVPSFRRRHLGHGAPLQGAARRFLGRDAEQTAPNKLRPAFRDFMPPNEVNIGVGFRPVLAPEIRNRLRN